MTALPITIGRIFRMARRLSRTSEIFVDRREFPSVSARVGLVLAAVSEKPMSESTKAAIGSAAPDFSLRDGDGNHWRLRTIAAKLSCCSSIRETKRPSAPARCVRYVIAGQTTRPPAPL